MPFRNEFACLWCGQDWKVRSEDDLEGWAALCPECLGKADDNGFLRGRLRSALRERASVATPSLVPPGSASTAAKSPAIDEPAVDEPAHDEPAHDDWYLRRGRFSRGPLRDGPWSMELDEATRWLDAVPIAGTIVELAAGTGWWSTLLAEKGELWVYDASDAALEAARRRLMAHGLLAHLHQRDPLAPADKQVDVVFGAYLLAAAEDRNRLASRIMLVRSWLKPGGSFVFLEPRPRSEARPDDGDVSGGTGGSVAGPAGRIWPRDIETLRAALLDGGLDPTGLSQTHSAFVMGRATARG